MPLTAGNRLGPYEIVAPLGAGGMGEVHRATDTKLKRQVAIKILPSEVAADAGRLARFQREAEVLASLNHPHIAAIYGLEEADGVKALVMELVEGRTLAELLEGSGTARPLPIGEALAIGRQIAEALEAAHEQGIVHRDLKPANIKVRDDGSVKVLDFGLAKARDKRSDSSSIDLTVDVMNSPTLTSSALSQAGMILGTAAYMSPEQARGRAVDKRTDIWAFGAVLFEMLAGRRAFEGDDVTELMAAVVKSTPDWSALPADVPPAVITLIKRCLEKDVKARIGDIAVARFLLSDDAAIAAVGPTQPSATASRGPVRQTLAWASAALVVGALAGWLLPRSASDTPPPPVTRLQMNVAPAVTVSLSTYGGQRPSRTAMSYSPDGRHVVFAGMSNNGGRLYLRDLSQPEAAALAGTDNGIAPFYSPDGGWIAFVADNKIKKIPAAGGPVTTVCDLPAGPFWGGSWAEDGTIFFAARPGLFRVSSSGGAPTAITTVDTAKGSPHLLPQPLPGGTFLLFTNGSSIVLLTLATGEQRVLLDGTDARFVSTGHLVFMKTGTLLGVPFDPRTGQTTGEPVALIDNVMHAVNAGNANDETQAGQFAISQSGGLIYAPGGVYPAALASLVWIDRKGAEQPVAGAPPKPYLYPRISPDGQKLAISIRRDGSRDTDIWVVDLGRGSATRLTFDGGGVPAWAPDGKRIIYGAAAPGGNSPALYAINADGSGTPELLIKDPPVQFAGASSRAIDALVFMRRPTLETNGLWVLPMTGADALRAKLFLESRFGLTHPVFSPDGRWIAYQSNESGAFEVYAQPYPGPGEKIRISNNGGLEPIWPASGREILFRASSRNGQQFFTAAIRSTSPLRVAPPTLLFDIQNGYHQTGPTRAWDATADGQRFVALKPMGGVADSFVPALHVILNWTDELKRRAPPAAGR